MPKKIKIKSKKEKEKWQLFGGEILPQKEMLTLPRIEMLGNREITIDGCLSVLEYSDTYMKLKLKKGHIIICGIGFDILSFEGTAITLKGKISSVEFLI